MRAVVLWATVLAAAFGVVEGAVAVYLREILYPEGFTFPLADMQSWLLRLEITREAATLVLLLAAACLAVRNNTRRFAVFALCFAVWDLVYYLTIWVALGWPDTPLDWDILFLIPLPWTAPMLAPSLVSIALIAIALLILRQPDSDDFRWLRPRDWAIEFGAALLILATFFWRLPEVLDDQVPTNYPWWLFALGWLLATAWFVRRWLTRPTSSR